MTTPAIGSAELNDSLIAVLAANALGHLKANTVLARVVARDWEDTPTVKGATIRVPKRGTLSANAKVTQTSVTYQEPDDDKVDVAIDKHYEITFVLEDASRALVDIDYLNGYMLDGVQVLAEKIDATIAALYSGFSQTIDASGGAGPLDASDFIEARRLLNAAKAPLAGRAAILHEDAEAQFQAIEEANRRDYSERTDGMPNAQALAYRSFYKGFDVFLDQNIVVATTCKNMFIQRNAIALVTRPLPQAPAGMGVYQRVMDEDNIGIRITLGYNKDLLGVQCTIDALWGCAELRDSHGITVSTTEV